MTKKVMLLIERDFNDAEALYPYYRLKEAGFDVKVAGTGEKEYRSKYGYPMKTDGKIQDFKADVFKGKKMTCFMAVKDDAINAGANYVDEEVVIDSNLITSRQPDDLPAFCREIIKALG